MSPFYLGRSLILFAGHKKYPVAALQRRPHYGFSEFTGSQRPRLLSESFGEGGLPVRAALDKDPAILAVLDRLWSRLGPDAFVLADHWESDQCAVGIASRRNPGVLVYLSCYEEALDRFGYELELPAPPSADFPYQVAGTGSGVSFEELAGVVARHLKHAEQFYAP